MSAEKALFRLYIPDCEVRMYIPRSSTKVPGEFAPAARFFVLPSFLFVQRLGEPWGPERCWAPVANGWFTNGAVEGSLLWNMKYGDLFTPERTDVNQSHQLLSLFVKGAAAPLLFDRTSYAWKAIHACDPQIPVGPMQGRVSWVASPTGKRGSSICPGQAAYTASISG
jgi:hypothetical protein